MLGAGTWTLAMKMRAPGGSLQEVLRGSFMDSRTALSSAQVMSEYLQMRGSSVMRSAGFPVFLIGSPINFVDCSIGSPITWHYTAWLPGSDEMDGGSWSSEKWRYTHIFERLFPQICRSSDQAFDSSADHWARARALL